MPILQGRLRGKMWIVGSFNHGCWLGSYEYSKRRRFEAEIKPGNIVFDIGAHVGFYTLLASELVKPNGEVIAFEPFERNQLLLRAHLKMNRVMNVQVFDAAVSDRCGVERFETACDTSAGRISATGELEIVTLSLDGLVASGRVPVPDVLKIDVEGGEFKVLSGAKSILARNRPIVFLATHSAEIHRECCNLLQDCGYVVEAIGRSAVELTDEVIARPSFHAGHRSN